MKRKLLVLLTLAAALPALPVLAADNSTLASPMASARSNEQAEQTVGAGISYGTNFFGDKSKWRAGLFGEANFSNGVFLSTTDGIGYRLVDNYNGFSVAASLGPSGSRKQSAGDNDNGRNRLQGMGEIGTRAQANLFVNYDSGPFHVNTALRQTLGDRRGTEVDVIGRYDAYSTKQDLVQLSAGFAYGNKTLMQTYFGVTPAQSAASGNSIYTPSAGVAGSSVGVMWRHALNQNWVTTVGAEVARLGSEAGDSPLAARRTNASVGASIGYRF
ncbi:MipA/OmpV family protein [Undibacterium sp.]|jgi:outer membrane protein|uniref:MipA/OmpV family protein n=1 Tax=Undibacterium sp. TaxID=1914977 RepID=UPI002BCC25BF|nr:MipA/OmpV family protein [Undibacterium sp.]HTD06793.1 MipA/OmpV family protein [Undibacterium sp.]